MNKRFNGAALKALRKERGITQKALAQICKVSNTYLCDIESGRTNPSLNKLLVICRALGVDLNTFIEGQGEKHE